MIFQCRNKTLCHLCCSKIWSCFFNSLQLQADIYLVAVAVVVSSSSFLAEGRSLPRGPSPEKTFLFLTRRGARKVVYFPFLLFFFFEKTMKLKLTDMQYMAESRQHPDSLARKSHRCTAARGWNGESSHKKLFLLRPLETLTSRCGTKKRGLKKFVNVPKSTHCWKRRRRRPGSGLADVQLLRGILRVSTQFFPSWPELSGLTFDQYKKGFF